MGSGGGGSSGAGLSMRVVGSGWVRGCIGNSIFNAGSYLSCKAALTPRPKANDTVQ